MKIQIRSLIIFMLLGLLFRPETSGSVDSKPSFYRGNDTLLQIISKRFVFKESDFETPGDVVVIKLNISERGYLTRISLLREFEYHDSRQMLNIFKTLRVWNPAYQNDKPVRSELIFSIIAYFFSFGEYWYTSLGYGIVFDSQGAYESELIEKFDIPEDTLYVQYDANAIDHYNLQYGRFLSGMSLEYFHKHFKRNKRGAFIKTILVEQSTGDGEIAWLEVKSWDDSTFNCLIPDDLQQIKNLKPGDKILIKKDDVWDWLIRYKKKSIGVFGEPALRQHALKSSNKKLWKYYSTGKIVQASMAADRNVLRSTKPIDSPARYSEDISELHKFLLDNLNKVSEPKTYHSFGYRETYIQNITSKSTIYISFVVLSNGNIQNPKVIIGGHAVHQRNILDSIRFASRWIPAQSGGKNVDSLVIIELNTRRQSP